MATRGPQMMMRMMMMMTMMMMFVLTCREEDPRDSPLSEAQQLDDVVKVGW